MAQVPPSRLVGTAGHVDHGKSSLIRALTGIEPDRWAEEKARGMTIDLGFAFLDLPISGRISMVDVPGHERFLSNMICGAMGVDVALLCVAADEGIMPQTREHFELLELLPVQVVIPVLTRSDLASPEMIEMVRDDVEQLLQGTRFSGADAVVCSAMTRDGLKDLREEIDQMVSSLPSRPSRAWVVPVDRVFTVKGAGTVITGTLVRGEIANGDPVIIEPGNHTSRARSIQSHDEGLASLGAGHRVALNLAGIDLESVQRGSLVGKPGTLACGTEFEAEMRWKQRPKSGTRVRVHVGTDEVIGRVRVRNETPNCARIRLEREAALTLDLSVILRNYSPPHILGGGQIVSLEGDASAATQTDSLEERILQVVRSGPYGAQTEKISRKLGMSFQELGDPLENLKSNQSLFGFAGLWMAQDQLDAISATLLQALGELHEKDPTAPTWTPEQVLLQSKLPLDIKSARRLFDHLVKSGKLGGNAVGLHLPGFVVKLNARQKDLLAKTLQAIESNGLTTPSPDEISRILNVPKQAIHQIIELGIRLGNIALIPDGLYFTAKQINQMVKICGALPSPFTAQAFRDATQTSRKYAIPVLEWMDAKQLTVRQGDTRIMGAKAQAMLLEKKES